MGQRFLIVVFLLTGCSNLSFVGEDSAPFHISGNSYAEEFKEARGTQDFYFWGLSPGKQKVNLDEATLGLGLDAPSFVSIEQSISPLNVLYTVFTLGLYCPVDYKISVLSSKRPLP